MAYAQRGGGGRGGNAKSGNDGVRLTGLFESKRKGLWVGTARPEEVDALIEKIKEARKAGVGLTVFLWQNDQRSRRDPEFSVSVNVQQDKQEDNRGGGNRGGYQSRSTGSRGSRAIEPDDRNDFAGDKGGDGPPKDDDLPF